MKTIIKNKKALKALVIILELLTLGFVIYILALPFYPAIKYNISRDTNINFQDVSEVKKAVEKIINTPEEWPEREEGDVDDLVGDSDGSDGGDTAPVKPAEPAKISNRVIIPKIGVNAPIIDTDNEEYGLSKGSWRIPETSTPDKGGNTVITGHRFKYLPPNNLTFYLFHKLEKGDIVSVVWEEKTYYYRIKEIKIVSKDEVSILRQTDKSTLTLFTCDPIYSTKNRLVIVSELIEEI